MKDSIELKNGDFAMLIASSVKQIHSKDNKVLALIFQPSSTFWLYFSKKLIDISLKNRWLRILNPNYEATSLIFIMKPTAS